MRMRMFDTKTGTPAGFVDIPDDILLAADRVHNWMHMSGAKEMCGLKLADAGGPVAPGLDEGRYAVRYRW